MGCGARSKGFEGSLDEVAKGGGYGAAIVFSTVAVPPLILGRDSRNVAIINDRWSPVSPHTFFFTTRERSPTNASR